MLDLLNCFRANERAKERLQEAQISGGVVQHTGEDPAAPKEKSSRWRPKIACVPFQPIQRRHHRGKNPDEQNRNLLDGMKVEVIGFMDRPLRGEVRAECRSEHDTLTQEERALDEHCTKN